LSDDAGDAGSHEPKRLDDRRARQPLRSGQLQAADCLVTTREGQQLQRLGSEGFSYSGADWADLGVSVDYNQPQSAVMHEIAERIAWRGTVDGQQRLRHALKLAVDEVRSRGGQGADELIRRFGRGGAETVADAVLVWLETERACAVGSNSRDSSSGVRPDRTSSTIW